MEDVSYPTRMTVELPQHYDRWQVALRVLIACGLGTLEQQVGGTFGLLYFLLPGLAAVLITQRTARGYLERDASWLTSALEWVVGLYAYMLFVTDRFPLERATRPVRLEIAPHGQPTLPNALLRLVTSLPHAILLCLLAIVAFLASLIMALTVLGATRVPGSLREFQQGLLAWTSRALAYHACLVDAYPPFRLGLHGGQPPQAGPAPGSSPA